MDIVNPAVEDYMASLLDRHDEPVLLEMEETGRKLGFPIIDRLVGVTVELLARSVGANRVFELGSGFGYSAYWFSRAVGPDGEVHCTDRDPKNEARALEYLSRAGLAEPLRWHVGDAMTAFQGVDGEFDVVFSDIDKLGYPDAWRAASERIRVGGLYLCDNVLWSGAVADPEGDHGRDRATIDAVLEHNRLIGDDGRYLSSIVPTRDGVTVALRLG